ncbi:hypothetical protein EBZ39_01810 [bacterium]|nr:hypothetical protein [bacterium]
MGTEINALGLSAPAEKVQPINRPDLEHIPYETYGKELLHSGLYGAMLAGGGSALYHLINGARTANPAALLRNPLPVSMLKEQEKEKNRRKKTERLKAAEVAAPAAAPAPAAPGNSSATSLLRHIHSIAGKLIPNQFIPDLPALPSGDPTESPTIAHRGWRTAANYLAAVGGGYGGMSLVKQITDKKKKEDLKSDVDDARREYFDALTGKTASVLDDVYEKHSNNIATTDSPWYDRWNPLMWNWNNAQQHVSNAATTAKNYGERGAENLWTAALLSALGTGALGAQYMYGQTKARTQAENLRRAQASRARLRSIQQTPWVDPEDLAAISGR